MNSTETKSQQLLLSTEECARALGVSPRKLWSMTFGDQPGLPYVRCGRLVRYPLKALELWVEEHQEGGAV